MVKRIILFIPAFFCLFLSACTASSQSTVPTDEALPDSRQCGHVRFEDLSITQGDQCWQDFYSLSASGIPCSVYLAYYYTLDEATTDPEYYKAEKDKYPVTYQAELTYDGTEYNITAWNSDKTVLDCDKTYKYLVHYTGEYDLPDAEALEYDHYILVNDGSVTYEDIEQGLLSLKFGDAIDHYSVCLNYRCAQ